MYIRGFRKGFNLVYVNATTIPSITGGVIDVLGVPVDLREDEVGSYAQNFAANATYHLYIGRHGAIDVDTNAPALYDNHNAYYDNTNTPSKRWIGSFETNVGSEIANASALDVDTYELKG